MTELIDRDALKDTISNIKLRVKNPEMMSGLVEMKAAMLREVEAAPTIEPEVRHGRWIDVPDDNTRIAKCSLCGFWQRTNGYDKTGKHLIHKAVYRYCAGCGARMDGGADNGTD